jgi:hypothetical protein
LGAEAEIEVVIPNLNWRYSGVTATNRAIAPLLAKQCRIVWFGPHRPKDVVGLTLRGLLRMRLSPPTRHPVRIWHARRNVEMIVGVVLRWLGFRFGLVFSSIHRRPTGAGPSRRPACREPMASARSGACARRRARTCSSRPCAGYCRATPISPRW